VHGQDRAVRVGDERRAPDQQVIEQAAERVDVGAVIDVAGAAALLG